MFEEALYQSTEDHIEMFLPRIDNFSKQTQSDAKEKRVAANIDVFLSC